MRMHEQNFKKMILKLQLKIKEVKLEAIYFMIRINKVLFFFFVFPLYVASPAKYMVPQKEFIFAHFEASLDFSCSEFFSCP